MYVVGSVYIVSHVNDDIVWRNILIKEALQKR